MIFLQPPEWSRQSNSVSLKLSEMYLVAYLEAEVALLPSKFALTRSHLDRLLAPG